jgi:hypothetical protein
MDTLKPLVELDELEFANGLSVPVFVHRDHRWTLCLIRWAQITGRLPTPCKIMTFDYHHDSLPPKNWDDLLKLKTYDLSIQSIISICDNLLSKNDDDWIAAGMELGIISNAIVFGVEDRSNVEQYERFKDSSGIVHRTFFPFLPGKGLRHQGWLIDLARESELSELWDAVGWECAGPRGIRFRDKRERFALDFDLDCFSIDWKGYGFPWPGEVWDDEFQKLSEDLRSKGWNGAGWIEQLSAAAGIVTFATEPECCGGRMKADAIWNCINAHLFGGRLYRRPL